MYRICAISAFQIGDKLLFLFQDDIIDDVGDFVAAAEILKERGAYKIYIMATHGLLSADAPRLIEESAIDEVRMPKFVVFNHLCFFFVNLS